jgi:hypothetical protein
MHTVKCRLGITDARSFRLFVIASVLRVDHPPSDSWQIWRTIFSRILRRLTFRFATYLSCARIRLFRKREVRNQFNPRSDRLLLKPNTELIFIVHRNAERIFDSAANAIVAANSKYKKRHQLSNVCIVLHITPKM